MKAHTQTFKDNLINLGKEIDAKVIYTINGVQTELDGDMLGSVTPHYEGAILKSVMKQVDIVSDIDIPLNTEINVQFGLRFDDENFEYVDYGNYIVFSSEKQEDTNNYKIIAYDKMLYAMKDYEPLFDTNLFDKENTNILEAKYGETITADVNERMLYIPCEPNTTYTLYHMTTSPMRNSIGTTQETPEIGITIEDGVYSSTSPKTITTNANAKYIVWQFYAMNDTQHTMEEVIDSIVIQKSSELSRVYPVTIREFIDKLCTKIGLTFANQNDQFTNYDKQITQELYKDLGFTYRDVLDQLAQVTASTICINKDDKLEIRYINDLDNELQEVEGSSLTISDAQDTKLKDVQVEGNTTQNGTPTPTSPIPISNVSGLQNIKFIGKNFANPNNFTFYNMNYVSISYDNSTNEMTATTLETRTNNDLFFRTKIPDELLVNGQTYSISSVNVSGAYQNLKLQLRNKDGSMASGKTQASSVTFDNTYSLFIVGNPFATGNVSVPSGSVCKIKNIQVVKSSSSDTNFEPYLEKTKDINLGKNLFDISLKPASAIDYDNGFTLIKSTNRVITISLPRLYEKGTYTISYDVHNSTLSAVGKLGVKLQNKKSGSVVDVISDVDNVNHTITFNANDDFDRIYFFINNDQSDTATISINNIQLEKGSTKTSYSPYFTPIELNKIGNYKDYIFKGKGINLFDKSTFTIGTIASTDTTRITSMQELYLEQGTYTFSWNGISPYNFAIQGQTIGKPPLSTYPTFTLNSGWQSGSSYSFTITTPLWVDVCLRKNDNSTITINEINNFSYQIVKGTSTTYEPYNAKDKWLLHKEIGKYILPNDSHWFKSGTANFNTFGLNTSYGAPIINSNSLCTHFKYATGNQNNCYWYGNSNLYVVFPLSSEINTKELFLSWINNNSVSLYYVLTNPTTEEITNSELISQLDKLEKAKLYQGVTNIFSTFPIKFSYATDYETIDEDYIKNTRADFGEKYGPVNSIVLSRSADTDNVYIQDEDSIEENGLCEIKIKDNQILNDNDRSDFLPGLLDQLGGIEYYINNFESIGITYLDLCDRYKVKIEDNIYDCVMFNNEVEIGDGLNEIIYTDKPEITQTDYKKASKTDKQERQTYLIVDKQNEKIEALVGDIDGEFASINLNVNGITSRVQTLETDYSGIEGEIAGVRSSIISQTATAITDWFNLELKSRMEEVESVSNTNNEEITKIQAYIRRGVITDPESPYYNQAYVEIGDDTNETTLRILKNRIQFLTNGVETAFISNNQLYINESTILTKEKVGHWVTTEDDNGLLNTYWEE